MLDETFQAEIWESVTWRGLNEPMGLQLLQLKQISEVN